MAALRGAKVLVVYPPYRAAQRGFQGQMAAGAPGCSSAELRAGHLREGGNEAESEVESVCRSTCRINEVQEHRCNKAGRKPPQQKIA